MFTIYDLRVFSRPFIPSTDSQECFQFWILLLEPGEEPVSAPMPVISDIVPRIIRLDLVSILVQFSEAVDEMSANTIYV